MDESPAWLAPSDEDTKLLVVITESGLEKETDFANKTKFLHTRIFSSKIS